MTPRNLIVLTACLATAAFAEPDPRTAPLAQGNPLYLDVNASLDQRVADLVSRLTLEEMALALHHNGPDITRIGLRGDKWNQCLNGVQWDRPTTLLPICTGLAATWDPDLIQHGVARVLADEARGIYNGWRRDPSAPGQHKGLIYRAPVLNIGRNPYWGRNYEAWGEDPFLTGRMAVAYVRGLQGDDPRHLKVAATLKHYAVNNVEADRMKLDAKVSERMLHEYWLPHFHDAVVEGKACSLMASYNAINGTPNNINHWLLTKVLKDQWHHEGFVVSDLGGVRTMVEGHANKRMAFVDAVAQSLMAGCDFSDKEYQENIPAAVREGKLTKERLDDAVTRVLRVRFRLGEFDPLDAHPYGRIPPDVVNSAAHQAVALKAAQESIVLLQNRDHLLPLDPARLKQVAVIGPFADAAITNGYNGRHIGVVTPLQGIRSQLANAAQVVHARGARATMAPGRQMDRENGAAADSLAQGIAAAKQADTVILCLGSDTRNEMEGKDRGFLGLPGNQQELAEAVIAANPRTVVVLFGAGPLAVPWLKQNAPAMLQAWWPGQQGGTAVADVLFGKVNPAGRLPHTVYASEKQVPPIDEYDISKGFTYLYVKGEPLYAFGHGLSYTAFAYQDLRVSPTRPTADGTLQVQVTVKNIGGLVGDEVVQLYTRATNPGVTRPAHELRGFQRVTLAAGETKTISLAVPAAKLARYDEKAHAFVVEPGDYEIQIGAASDDIRVRARIAVADQRP